MCVATRVRATGNQKLKRPHKNKIMKVEATVLCRISSELPASPIPFNPKWKHLKGLPLAEPGFSIPARVHLHLGEGVFA